MNAIRGFVLDSARAWREGRLRSLLQEWRESLVFPVFRHGRLIVIEHDLNEERPANAPEGVTLEVKDDLDEWAPFLGIANHRSVEFMRRTAVAGRTCIVARRGDTVIGYTWISEKIDPRLELVPVPLPDDAAYGWNLFVTSSERSTGVGSALVGARLNLARRRGFRRMWRAIDAENAPTIRTVQKTWGSSSRVIGEMTYVYVLGHARGRMHRAPDTPVAPPRDGEI